MRSSELRFSGPLPFQGYSCVRSASKGSGCRVAGGIWVTQLENSQAARPPRGKDGPMKPITFALAIVFILLSSVAEYLVASAAPTSLSVTIVGPDNNDPRWRAVDEAVEFWNQQRNGAAIAVGLGPINRLIQA